MKKGIVLQSNIGQPEVPVDGRSLRRGLPAVNRIDLTGHKFGRLTAISRSHTKEKISYWILKCECGKDHVASISTLRSGKAKSCGCARASQNRLSDTETYHSWRSMQARCSDPRNENYKFYGGRGIKVCERWMEFKNFLADMGFRPTGKSIDRYPNKDGNYEPGNCRWATKREQMLNMRSNHLLTVNGESRTITEWAEVTGAKMATIWYRAKQGRSPEDCIHPGHISRKRQSR